MFTEFSLYCNTLGIFIAEFDKAPGISRARSTEETSSEPEYLLSVSRKTFLQVEGHVLLGDFCQNRAVVPLGVLHSFQKNLTSSSSVQSSLLVANFIDHEKQVHLK